MKEYHSGQPLERQIAAIKYKPQNAADLARENPSIAEDYRSGMKVMDIVDKYDVQRRFPVTRLTAWSIVTEALKNLIPAEELVTLGKQHKTDSLDFHRKENKKNGKGAPYLSREKLQEASLKGARAQGFTPWSLEEITDAISLTQNKSYREIAEILNDKYHPNTRPRSKASIKSNLQGKLRDLKEFVYLLAFIELKYG